MYPRVPHVLRAEGVNFRSTLDDTHDIGTIRGAGLALLSLDKMVNRGLLAAGITTHKLLFAGASQCAYRFDSTPEEAETARATVTEFLRKPDRNAGTASQPPFHHLSFVVDVAPSDDADTREVEARNRARQFRQWTLVAPDFVPGAPGFDAMDRVRPAVQHVPLPDAPDASLSASTAARHIYGQSARQRFYANQFCDDAVNPAEGLRFVDSLQELVNAPPVGPSSSLHNAMAIIYADGNSFRAIREAVGTTVFAQQLDELRLGLLRHILGWLRDGWERGDPSFLVAHRDGTSRLRLETLLWGGDEFVFVVPAWLALDFVQRLLAFSRNWTIDGHRLTHTIAVVTCHCKTPIRLVRAAAHEIADAIKNSPQLALPKPNVLGIEVFEGQMPPLDGLGSFRARLYGNDGIDPIRSALDGEDFDTLRSNLKRLVEGERLPRSQVHSIVRETLHVTGSLASMEADKHTDALIRAYAVRTGVHSVESLIDALHVPTPKGATNRGLAMNLALLARLWDYIDPLSKRASIQGQAS